MNQGRAVIKAPCKLNLYLDVIGKREDGYHDIETVMQAVTLFNTIEITLGGESGIEIASQIANMPLDSRNTAYKAAAVFAEKSGVKLNCRIELHKEVPFEAGMGSASADAAGVLLGLNALFSNPLSEHCLDEAALSVGADVPFLLKGGTALCKGVGERITPLKALDGLYFVVAKGNRGFSTAQIFSRFDDEKTPSVFLPDGLLKAIDDNIPQRVAKNFVNRLEYCLADSSTAEYKSLFLSCGAISSVMTGSGSAVFGAFLSKPQAHAAARLFSERAKKLFGEEPYVAVTEAYSGGPQIDIIG